MVWHQPFRFLDRDAIRRVIGIKVTRSRRFDGCQRGIVCVQAAGILASSCGNVFLVEELSRHRVELGADKLPHRHREAAEGADEGALSVPEVASF